MKGIDISESQLEAAADFICERRTVGSDIKLRPETEVAISWGNLVRLVAWYGAIRANAVARGGDPVHPGKVVEKLAAE